MVWVYVMQYYNEDHILSGGQYIKLVLLKTMRQRLLLINLISIYTHIFERNLVGFWSPTVL